jgi:hypothetical protein
MAEAQAVRLAKDIHKPALMNKPNVVGVGVGFKTEGEQKTDELCVVVMVEKKLPLDALSAQDVVPKKIDNVKTDVVQVGELRALQSPTGRFRPAPGGVSIGHYQITAGTLGVVVRDRSTGERLILSNNHVLANSNDAQIGDPILQPGPYDGGRVDTDTIAHLYRFVNIQYNTQPGTCSLAGMYADVGNAIAKLVGSSHRVQTIQVNTQAANRVDAALAKPVSDGDVLDEILNIGTVSGTVTPSLGLAVRKMGRTTGLTTGTINIIDATVTVTYGAGKSATYDGQLVAGPMSQGGDSGSLVVAAAQPKAVGLLFAGSEQSTIFCPIQDVLDALDITI